MDKCYVLYDWKHVLKIAMNVAKGNLFLYPRKCFFKSIFVAPGSICLMNIFYFNTEMLWRIC